MDFERLPQRERLLAMEALRAVYEGQFIDDAELQTVTGFSRTELEDASRQLEAIGKPDEQTIRAIGQCLNNLAGYPHGMEGEVEQLLGCSMEELQQLTNKWFGSVGNLERLQ